MQAHSGQKHECYKNVQASAGTSAGSSATAHVCPSARAGSGEGGDLAACSLEQALRVRRARACVRACVHFDILLQTHNAALLFHLLTGHVGGRPGLSRQASPASPLCTALWRLGHWLHRLQAPHSFVAEECEEEPIW